MVARAHTTTHLTKVPEDASIQIKKPTGVTKQKGADIDYMSKRVNELETTTHNLYKRLQEKEKENEELTKYKKRYEKIIKNARKKKESQLPFGSTSEFGENFH